MGQETQEQSLETGTLVCDTATFSAILRCLGRDPDRFKGGTFIMKFPCDPQGPYNLYWYGTKMGLDYLGCFYVREDYMLFRYGDNGYRLSCDNPFCRFFTGWSHPRIMKNVEFQECLSFRVFLITPGT